MAHTVKRIARGPSTKVNAYAGPAGELVMDTTSNDLVLETGVQGGVRMAKASTAIAAANGLSVTAGGTLGEATTISGVDATTSAKGVVQLSDATTGTSQTKAATEKAVSDALQAAKDYADQAAAGGGNYTGTAPIAVDTTTHVVSISDASTSAKGAVQLSNATTGTSQTTAATEKAVADALQAAKDYTDTHGTTYTGTAPINVSGSTISVSDATTAAKGVVKVGTNIDVASGTISVKPWAAYAADHSSVTVANLQDGCIVQTDEALSPSTAVLASIEQSLSGNTAVVPSSYAVQQAIRHDGTIVEQISTRTTTGAWTLSDLIIGKLLLIGMSFSGTNPAAVGAYFRITEGSVIGVSPNIAANTSAFAFGRASSWYSPPSFMLLPNTTSLTINVNILDANITLYAFQ